MGLGYLLLDMDGEFIVMCHLIDILFLDYFSDEIGKPSSIISLSEVQFCTSGLPGSWKCASSRSAIRKSIYWLYDVMISCSQCIHA